MKGFLDSADQREGRLMAVLKDFSKDPEGFVVLAGENGTGKTYLARCVLEDYFISKGRDPMYSPIRVRQRDIQEKIQEHRQQYGNSMNLQDQLCNTDLLLIDDLGTRPPTDALLDFLFCVIDKRWEENRGTIITTNLNFPSIRQQFGDAIASRIKSGHCFRLDGKDRRGKSKEK